MDENKKSDVSKETSLIDDEKNDESKKITSGQIAPESPQEPKHNKNNLKKILIAAGILIVCVGGYLAYSKYQAAQEARRIDVVIDTETKEVPYGTDLMSLITVNKADDVVMELVDADGNEVTEPKANTEYTVVYVATASDNSEEFKHTIVFIDKTAPVISGVEDYKEVAFGSEFDPLNGVSALDDVDGEINVMVEGDSVDTKLPKEYSLIYKATDLSDNEASIKSTVKVLEPTCGANASWNGEDCVCDSGYQGDAWAGCTAIPVKKPTNTGSSGSSNGYVSTGKSQAQIDCENSWGTWKDNSWCDWGSSSSSNSSDSGSSNNSSSGNGSTGGSSSGSSGGSQTCTIEPFKGGIYESMDACKAAGESGASGGLSWICYDAYDTCGNHLGYGLDW